MQRSQGANYLAAALFGALNSTDSIEVE